MDTLVIYLNDILYNLETNFINFFLIYFFSIIIFFSLSLPGGALILFASGFFFGFYIGFLVNIVAILIGSFLFVYFTKNILKIFFTKFYFRFSDRLTTIISFSSYEYLIIFRLIYGNPLFIQNLAYSFLDISKFKFLISSFIGFCPIVILLSYFGSKLYNIYEIKNIRFNEIVSKEFIFFTIIFILILIIRIIFKSKKK